MTIGLATRQIKRNSGRLTFDTRLPLFDTPEPFFDRITQAITACKTPLIVGIDPRLGNLPASIRNRVAQDDLEETARAFEKFGCEIIDVVASFVPAVKPQAAFFEMLGPAGMVALANVIDHATDKGLLVILDGKRNDIGSTATAYARGYLGRKPKSGWGCDALTINPYMGDDSLQPFIDRALETGSGLFALVKTSNPGSNTFQELVSQDRKLYQHVANWVQASAKMNTGKCGYGVLGAVIGATHPAHLAELRLSMPNTFFLIPGFGAQGGRAADIATAFDSSGGGAVVNSSRGIIFAYEQSEFDAASSWQKAVELATLNSIALLRDVVPQSSVTSVEAIPESPHP